MSADQPTPDVETVLSEHRYRDLLGDYEVAPYYKHFGCSCGWEQNIAGMSGWRSWVAAHEAHVAAVLEPLIREREAKAWEKGMARAAGIDYGVSRGDMISVLPGCHKRGCGCNSGSEDLAVLAVAGALRDAIQRDRILANPYRAAAHRTQP